MNWLEVALIAMGLSIALLAVKVVVCYTKVEKIVDVALLVLAGLAIFGFAAGGIIPALDEAALLGGEPTHEGMVEEFRITGSDRQYSGTLVVDGQRIDFTAYELPVFNVGYEYQIWMNEGRLLKYQEVD